MSVLNLIRKGMAAAAAIALCAAVFSGCGSYDESVEQRAAVVAPGSLSVSEIAGSLAEASGVKMVLLDSSAVSGYYSYDPNSVEEAQVYISADSNKADEVAVFEIAAGQDEAGVIDAVNMRVQSKERSFRNINPSEHEKLRRAISVNISGYVVLAVTANPDSARSVIEELFYLPESTVTITEGEK